MDSREIKVQINAQHENQPLVEKLSKEFSAINPKRRFGKVQWKLCPNRWKTHLFFINPNEKQEFLDKEIFYLLDFILEQKKTTEEFRGLQFSKRFLMLILEYYRFLEQFSAEFVLGRLDSFLAELGIQESENGILDINPVPIKIRNSNRKIFLQSKMELNYIFFENRQLIIIFEYLEQGVNVDRIVIHKDLQKGFGPFSIDLKEYRFLIGQYQVKIYDDEKQEVFSNSITILPPELNIEISPKIFPSVEILNGKNIVTDKFFSIKYKYDAITLTFSPRELVDAVSFEKNAIGLKIFEKIYEGLEITKKGINIFEINLLPDRSQIPIQYFVNKIYGGPILTVDLCQFFCFLREINDKQYFIIQFSLPMDVTIYLTTKTKRYQQIFQQEQEGKLEIDAGEEINEMDLTLEYNTPNHEGMIEKVQYSLFQKGEDLVAPTGEEIERAVVSLLEFLKGQ